MDEHPDRSEGEDRRPAVRTRRVPGVNRKTLSFVRWIAVVGQLATILAVQVVLEYPFPVFECLAIVAILGVSNLWLATGRFGKSRLTNYHAARFLAFDLLQISALAYFTGGLTNPFAVLIAVPVTVAATILSRGATLMLTIMALFCATFLAFFHLPLPWMGAELTLPVFYMAGLWTAVAVLVVFTSVYVWAVSEESRRRETALAETEAALSREQHMADLGTLAAAAAHELGSPLNTIALISADLAKEISPDDPIREDVDVLVEQAYRCREILAALGRTPEQRAGQPFDTFPFTNMVEEAARDHIPDGIEISMTVDPACQGAEPIIPRRPEFLQGIGNLIQNAGQFAKSRVTLTILWTESEIRLRIDDDGPGFPGWMLDSLGEPYVSTRAGRSGHLGLGIFIAQTLLDRTGAMATYKNQKQGGARIDIVWERTHIEAHGIHPT